MPRPTLAAALLLVAACSKSGSDEPTGTKATKQPPPAAAQDGRIALSVTEKGFEPSPVQIEKGKPVTLVVTRKTDQTCATELTLPEYKINQKLPLNQPVEITFTPDKAGELVYGCAMDRMISGVLQVR